MRPPVDELVAAHTAALGERIELDLGGSETLLPRIIAAQGGGGDLFITHEPFPSQLAARGWLAAAATVGWLRPVVLTTRGNPQRVATLADLARPGLRVGLMDPRVSTCGELTAAALKTAGLSAAVQRNVVTEQRSHQELAAALRAGALDAAVVWNFAARLHAEHLEVVEVAADWPAVAVLVCRLSGAAQPVAAQRFLERCASPSGREVFIRHGYTAGPMAGDRP